MAVILGTAGTRGTLRALLFVLFRFLIAVMTVFRQDLRRPLTMSYRFVSTSLIDLLDDKVVPTVSTESDASPETLRLCFGFRLLFIILHFHHLRRTGSSREIRLLFSVILLIANGVSRINADFSMEAIS